MLEVSSTELLALTLSILCWIVYAGTVVSFSLKILFAKKQFFEAILRSFEGMGVILGLGLGGSIYTFLFLIFSFNTNDGQFVWPEDQMFYALLVTFFVTWVHNVRLEIWSLEPMRIRDLSMQQPDLVASDNSDATTRKIRSSLILHGALVAAVRILLPIALLR